MRESPNTSRPERVCYNHRLLAGNPEERVFTWGLKPVNLMGTWIFTPALSPGRNYYLERKYVKNGEII